MLNDGLSICRRRCWRSDDDVCVLGRGIGPLEVLHGAAVCRAPTSRISFSRKALLFLGLRSSTLLLTMLPSKMRCMSSRVMPLDSGAGRRPRGRRTT